MTEKPILFSGAMVAAILAGRKTVTRRVVKPQPKNGIGSYMEDGTPGQVDWVELDSDGDPCDTEVRAPYRRGDVLWVRETWHSCQHCEKGLVIYRDGSWSRSPSGAPDDGGDCGSIESGTLPSKCRAHGWRPSIFMPRWACRLLLSVVSVRVERLRDITDDDAQREGVGSRDEFRALWDSLNGKRGYGWATNPWVWRVRFERKVAGGS